MNYRKLTDDQALVAQWDRQRVERRSNAFLYTTLGTWTISLLLIVVSDHINAPAAQVGVVGVVVGLVTLGAGIWTRVFSTR